MSVYPPGCDVVRRAQLSEDRKHRYRLTRIWEPSLPVLPWLMLNPSVADAEMDDATIRRCVGFGVKMGFGGIGVWNLFSYVSTDPDAMLAAGDAGAEITGGWENDHRLRNLLIWADKVGVPVIAGWGVNAPEERVKWLLGQVGIECLHALSITKDGHPAHPLRLPRTSLAKKWPKSEGD